MIIGSKLIFKETLPSTNTYLSQLLRDQNPPEGTIVYTNFQSAGRGQSGNKWESEDGKNLLISILIFPSMIKPVNQFIISMAISLGISDFLDRHMPGSAIKWPNDIYLNNDKIAGILIENSIMDEQIKSTIAGVGININQDVFLSDAPNPVSLKLITGISYDLAKCLNQLAYDLDKRYKQLISEDFIQIKKDYVSRIFRMNEWADFKDINGAFRGRIISVKDSGRLQVENLNGKMLEYSFKELDFIL
jgi:BirA family biotin operon repressor/biotin-[acetyl-CoA-carboxylase] ligase